VLLVSPRFVYLIAALCSLYLSVAPFLGSFHSPITFFRIALWIGTALLLIAAVSPSNRKSHMTALVGSTVTVLLLVYGISRFVAFRLGYVHGRGQLGVYRPNTFDRVNQIVTKPLLLLFLISSLASLLVSALITLRLRRTGSSPFTESTPG
jgi:hypothetical protein